MRIDIELIDYLQNLAYLSLSASEKQQLYGDLKKIIGYMNRLSELDTDVLPDFSCPDGGISALRGDQTAASPERELLLSIAPGRERGMFIAPKKLSEES